MEETGLVKYETKGGQEISLSPSIVRRYLVQGKSEFVTDQEIMYFMAISKARGLNPFVKDAYLIKYSPHDNAQIITSIDFFRKRARAQKDCHGWQAGIIVQNKEGDVKYSKGLILDGETLLGGWFKAIPDGWEVPFELEVNLKGYIKHKKDGSVTSFWKEHNQPSQIRKVAESQGLRTVWPDEFQQLYTDVEMGADDKLNQGFEGVIDVTPEDAVEPERPPADVAKTMAAQSNIPEKDIREFISFIAKKQEKTTQWVEENALKSPESFIRAVQVRLDTLKAGAKKGNMKGTAKGEPLGADAAHMKEFWNLRKGAGGKTGLKAYVSQHIDRIYNTYSDDVRTKLIEKFNSFYPGETFPAPFKKPETHGTHETPDTQGAGETEATGAGGAGGADEKPPFKNPFENETADKSMAESMGQSATEQMGEDIRKAKSEEVDLINRYNNSVESVMKFDKSGVEYTIDDFEKFMMEMAHMEGITFASFQADVMRRHQFPDYFDKFISRISGREAE